MEQHVQQLADPDMIVHLSEVVFYVTAGVFTCYIQHVTCKTQLSPVCDIHVSLTGAIWEIGPWNCLSAADR